MIPYLIFIFILLLLTIFSYIYKKNDGSAFKIASIIVLIFIGLRAPVVGADTWYYYRHFLGEQQNYQDNTEFLYNIYVSIQRIVLFQQGSLYMLANTFLSFFIIYKLIDKFSSWKTFSVLLFFYIVSYQNYFVALRQILGLSLLLYGLWKVVNGDKYRWAIYILCTFIGWGLHTFTIVASFFFVIAYFVRIPNRSLGIVAIVGSAFFGILLHSFNVTDIMNKYVLLNIEATERLDHYFEMADYMMKDSNQTTLSLLLRPSIVACVGLFCLPKEKINHWFTVIYIIGICLRNIFVDFFLIARVVLPFSIFGIIVLSWIVEKNNHIYKLQKNVINFLLMIFIIYYTQAFVKEHVNWTIYNPDRMHPYYFFFEDYKDHPSIRNF